MILGPTGLFAALDWGVQGDEQSRRARLLGDPLRVQLGVGQQRLGLRGPGRHLRLQRQRRRPAARTASHWDIATGLVMLIGRFIPIIAPLALAAAWRRRSRRRSRSARCAPTRSRSASCCWERSCWSGRLLFLPAAVLGPGGRAPRPDSVWRLSDMPTREFTDPSESSRLMSHSRSRSHRSRHCDGPPGRAEAGRRASRRHGLFAPHLLQGGAQASRSSCCGRTSSGRTR